MQDKTFVRVLLPILFALSGLLIGVFLVPVFEGGGSQYIKGIGAIIAVTVFVYVMRAFLVRRGRLSEMREHGRDGSQVEFVVDTFHDLVAKLREKEKELEALRAVAEKKADSIEAYNDNILQSVPSGVVSIDNSLQIKSLNQAAERILGITSEEVINKPFKEVFGPPLSSLIDEDKTVNRGEYSYLTKDSRNIWLGITASQLKNAEDEKIGMIFIFTDLTDIKALQSQVELKHRLSQLGEMSAGISHEMRNSMAVIAGYAKLLKKKADPAAVPTVEAISAEIVNMDKIISELLAFAKPSVLSRERIDLNELLKEAAVSAVGGNSLIETSIQSEGPVYVEADEVLIRQALMNLLNNAAEAMPDGGRIDIRLFCRQAGVEISISDSGCGIPEDIMQKIFLPFYTTKEKGIGFGLALVQKIIVSHGGHISVESKEGRGATFRMTIPFTQ